MEGTVSKTSRTGLLAVLILFAASLCQHAAQAYLLTSAAGFYSAAQLSSVMAAIVPAVPALSSILRGGLSQRRAPVRSHVFLSILLSGSFLASAHAPRFLPLQLVVIAKSCKLLPTLLLGSLWLRKRYSAVDWTAATLTAVGLALCLSSGIQKNTPVGIRAEEFVLFTVYKVHFMTAASLCGMLLLDSFAVLAQERLFVQYGIERNELLSRSYGCAAVIGIALAIVQSGDQSTSADVGGANGAIPTVADASSDPFAPVLLVLALCMYALSSLACTHAVLTLVSVWGGAKTMFATTVCKAVLVIAGCAAAGRVLDAGQSTGLGLVVASVCLAVSCKGDDLGTQREDEDNDVKEVKEVLEELPAEVQVTEFSAGLELRRIRLDLLGCHSSESLSEASSCGTGFCYSASSDSIIRARSRDENACEHEHTQGYMSSPGLQPGQENLRRRHHIPPSSSLSGQSDGSPVVGPGTLMWVVRNSDNAGGSDVSPPRAHRCYSSSGDGASTSRLGLLRASSSRALTAVSAVISGIERPRETRDTLSPVNLSGRGGAETGTVPWASLSSLARSPRGSPVKTLPIT